MNKTLIAGMMVVAMCSGALPVLAEEEALCLDCHEPAEDWEGLSADDILAKAKDASIKRHADNQELSDDQLKALIAELMPK